VKLHLSGTDTVNVFTGYGAGYVEVNRTRYDAGLIVTPDRIIERALPPFSALTAAHFSEIADLKPAIVLLGTGPALRFPTPSLTRALVDAAAGLEVMDTAAACRTYNILSAEGRNVVAAILMA
jgi:uncharacterized protein